MEMGGEIMGTQAFVKKLQSLGIDEMDKIVHDVFNPVANKAVEIIKQNTPVSGRGHTAKEYISRTHESGNLLRSVWKRWGRDPRRQYPTVFVGPNRKNSIDAWYDHIVIGGHEYGGTKVAPNPFVRRSFEQMKGMLPAEMVSKIKLKITERLNRQT